MSTELDKVNAELGGVLVQLADCHGRISWLRSVRPPGTAPTTMLSNHSVAQLREVERSQRLEAARDTLRIRRIEIHLGIDL